MSDVKHTEERTKTHACVCERTKTHACVSPCDVCRHYPPRSTDGKPCSMCPAEPAEPIEQVRTYTSLADCVSRQDAIDAIVKQSVVDKTVAKRVLVQLPSAETFSYGHENDWIPVSEKLPEEAYPVIVTWKNDDPAWYYQYILGKHYVGVAHYKNGKWYWYSSITEDVLMEYGRYDSEEFDEAIKVVAWMPMPEPYKAGEQE